MSVDVNAWVRSNIVSLKPYDSARDLIHDGLLLDANENPHPHTYAGISVNRYPDPKQIELRGALADYVGLAVENVVAGNGSDEVLDWIFKVLCQPGLDKVAIAEPTYGMYRVMADIFGISVVETPLDENFGFKADSLLRRLPKEVKVLFLCSPNNPTGNLLEEEEILQLAAEWNKPIVVDEAYVEFSSRPSLARHMDRCRNLIIMRTLSKAFGQAGIRLGYLLADSQLVDHFLKVKAPYNLNSITQAAGIRILRNLNEVAGEVDGILEERRRVAACLMEMPGVRKVFASDTNFLLFRCKGASEICRLLLAEGIVVRDRSRVPGLADCIRLTIGTPEENEMFLRRFKVFLEGGGI